MSKAALFEAIIDWKNHRFLEDLRASTRRGLYHLADQGCVPTGAILRGYTAEQKLLGARRDGSARYGRKPVVDESIRDAVIRAFQLKAEGAPHTVITENTGLYPPTSSSWDITWLRGAAKLEKYPLYTVLDIFSRYVVGWMITEEESSDLAKQLIAETARKQGIQPNQLTLHTDNGSPMT